MKENHKKVFSNVVWAISGKIVNMAGALLVGILVARYLGPEQYGLMNYIISYVSIFAIIATCGLDNIEIRELSKNGKHRDYILGTCFRIRLICATIAVLLVVVTLLIYEADRFTSIMILLYASTLYSACFNIVRNYFTSIVKNEYIVKTEIIRTIIGALIKVFFLSIKAPLEYFIVATIFDTFLVASGYLFSYRKIVGKIGDWKYDSSIVSFFLKESFPLLLSGAAVIIYQRIDQVMIGNMLNNKSVGLFATAGKLVDIILFLPDILTQTITPILIRIRENGTVEEYTKRIKQFMSIVVWISIMLSIFVSLLAYWMIVYTYGEQYVLAVPVLQIMTWKTVCMALSSSGGQIIIMEGIQKWAFVRNIIGCILCVCLNLLFIPQYGIIASAWVTIITVLASGTIANVFIPSYHKILRIQLYALFQGWRELGCLRIFLKFN